MLKHLLEVHDKHWCDPKFNERLQMAVQKSGLTDIKKVTIGKKLMFDGIPAAYVSHPPSSDKKLLTIPSLYAIIDNKGVYEYFTPSQTSNDYDKEIC